MAEEPRPIRTFKGIPAGALVETRGESSKRNAGEDPCVETYEEPIEDVAEAKPSVEPLDEASTQLILQLQLEDFQHLEDRSKGKEREGVITDSALARKLYKEELDAVQQIMYDRRMTKSIAAAVQYDGQVITLHREQEMHATVDHRAACCLGGRREPATSTAPPASEEEYDDAFYSRLSALYVGSVSESVEEEETNTPHIDCTICGDTVPQSMVANLLCGHPYCADCLQKLYEAALHDDTLFPPKCCQQQITIDIAKSFLGHEMIQVFEKKKVEFDTSDKTYCCLPTCSRFIPPAEISDERAVCSNCGTTTCTICKTISHEGSCPKDKAMNELLQVAKENGWQRCRSCKRMIELHTGCYHMTCHCGHQFCYICGDKWKICGCPHWDEARLFVRANQVVDREHDRELPRARRVERAMRNLQGCTHTDWRRINGRHVCEGCSERLSSFILQCERCRLRACVRCRMNRF